MRQPPILMYHWFRAAGEASRSRSPQLELTPERFERQLRHLARRGFRPVTLARAMSRDASPADIVLTFDDGTRDFWDHARPALEAHGFVATLFVVTGHVGGSSIWDQDVGEPARPLLDWGQLEQLARCGFEIGSHTHTHRVLPRLPPDEARDEMVRSRRTIAERLGQPPRSLAYPRGAFDERHKAQAREAGFGAACAVALRWRDLLPTDRFALRRVTVKGHEPLLLFRLRLAAARRVRLRAERE